MKHSISFSIAPNHVAHWRIVDGRIEVEYLRFLSLCDAKKRRCLQERAISAKPLTTMDHFAQLLSEGLSVRQAAGRMGFSYDYGNAMLQRIRRKLGAQAI